jgi:hypothetical protein
LHGDAVLRDAEVDSRVGGIGSRRITHRMIVIENSRPVP